MRLLTKLILLVLLITSSGAVIAEKVSPETIPNSTTVDAHQAKMLFDSEVAFIDVRKDKDWDAGRVPGAIHLDVKKIFSAESLAEEVAKDEEVVIYCNGPKCMRSSKAVKMAVKWGYSKVYYFREGFPAWKSARNPVE